MTELVEPTERSPDSTAYAASLLQHYGFDLGGDTIEGLLLAWQEQYPAAWLRLATIEALYQGRYKAISVAQILALWQRRSQPVYHFNREFERLICDRLPQALAPPAASPKEEPFLTRSAQAMAKLPLPGVGNAQTTLALQSAEAMQALRTLYGDVTASSLADRIAASNEPTRTRSHADTLRSNTVQSDIVRADTERSHKSLLPASVEELAVAEPDEAPTQSKVGSPLRTPMSPSALLSSDSIASLTASNGKQAQSPTAQTASIARILQQLADQELRAKPIFSGVGLLAQTLKPKPELHFAAPHQPLWLTNPSQQPIHQFTPASASDFHRRLKTVAQLPDGLPDALLDGLADQDGDRPPIPSI